MTKLPLIFFALFTTALFSSCKDEVPEPPPGNGGDTTYSTRNYLAKTVYTTGATVGTTTFRYDAQNKLIWFANTSNQASDFQDTSEITRNAQGAISKIIYYAPSYNDREHPVDDNVIQDVYYDAAASRYTHKVVQYTSLGTPFKDSVVYTADAQNRITKESMYYYNFSGNAYVLYGTTDYIYTSTGDVTSRKTLFNNVGGTTNNYEFTFTYTYDDKVNALNLGNEAIILAMGESWSGHNPLTITSTYPPPDNIYNQTLTYTYKYNTANRPLTADITGGGTTTTIVYTYQ